MINYEANSAMHIEVPASIVEPYKEVVRTAMQRLDEARVNEFGRREVALFDAQTNRLYHVSDIGMFDNIPILKTGLFIDGLQLDEKGKPIRKFTGIQIPRSPEYVNRQTLFIVRGSKKEDVERLAAELNSATRVDIQVNTAAWETFEGMRSKNHSLVLA
jgi:hypothetical protein